MKNVKYIAIPKIDLDILTETLIDDLPCGDSPRTARRESKKMYGDERVKYYRITVEEVRANDRG